MPRKMNVVDRVARPLGELRCPNCNKLLGKEVDGGSYAMEFKCPRCGDLSLFMRKKK